MTEIIWYEFESFRLDPGKRILTRAGELVRLRPKAFEVLLVLVQHHGQTLTIRYIIERVWEPGFGDAANFHVTLRAVRQALGDSAQTPRFIVRDANGYRFAAEVRKRPNISETLSQPSPNSFESSPATHAESDAEAVESLRDGTGGDPWSGPTSTEQSELSSPGESDASFQAANQAPPVPFVHLFSASGLYASLFAVALLLEVSYNWKELGSRAMQLAFPVFGWVFLTSAAGLTFDWARTIRGKRRGLLICVLVFVAALIPLYSALIFFLPDYPLTSANFQSRTAQTAYLKDASYFLPLAVVFLILPYHFVAAIKRELLIGNFAAVLSILTGDSNTVSPAGAIYLRVKWLGVLLISMAIIALLLTNYLLDSLKPAEYINLFSQLVMIRLGLYFALGLECILWFAHALNELKRESLAGLGIALYKKSR